MTSIYYTPSGTPQTGSKGSSAAIRAELAAIAAGFALLPPTLAGSSGALVVVNASGTALTTTPSNGITAGRPGSSVDGTLYFDKTLGIPIWALASSGTGWVNAAGVAV